MASEALGHTFNGTVLVHEAYLWQVWDQHFEGGGHFFAAATDAMRRILMDSARRKHTEKRGWNSPRVDVKTLSVKARAGQPILSPRTRR